MKEVDKQEIELNGVVFKSQEQPDGFCFGCEFYMQEFSLWCSPANALQPCTPQQRADGKHVVWVKA